LSSALLFVGLWVFPAYFGVSLLLPWVCNHLHSRRRHLGLAYGFNTLAFCVGLIGFTLLAPRVSVFYSMKLAIVLFAVAVGFLLTLTLARPATLWKPLAAAGIFAVACVLVPRGFDPHYLDPGSVAARAPVRALKSNGAHTTYVVAAPEGDYLFFDGHPMSGTGMPQNSYMRLMAHFPLLAHPDPKRALLICYGVGNTAAAIATHRTIEAIDVVELNEKVIKTAPEFARVTNAVHEDPRIRFIVDDGRSFLKTTRQKYDLITSEPPPPMQAGVYRLYTQDYYRQVLACLSPQGMMTQWIPTYQMPDEAIELAIRTFINVFPHTLIFTGGQREFVIMGSPAPIDLRQVEARFYEQPAVAADLRRTGTAKPMALLARVVQGDDALRRRFGEGRVIRDVHNDLEFLFDDPSRPEAVAYDPFEILADARLAGHDDLRGVLTHLGRLRYHVPRYPIATLLTAREVVDQEIKLADVDWVEVGRLLENANRLRGEGNIHGAYQEAVQALEIAPEQPGVLLLAATLQVDLGFATGAAETLRRFQQIEPYEAAGYHMLGTLMLSLDRKEQALAALRRAVELDPHSPDACHSLGNALIRSGQLDEGLRYLRQALTLAPGREDTQRLLAAALKQQSPPPPNPPPLERGDGAR
jgi:spermidine synthase